METRAAQEQLPILFHLLFESCLLYAHGQSETGEGGGGGEARPVLLKYCKR